MSMSCRVPSNSMRPTLALGQSVAVDEDTYRTSPPTVGDVVLFFGPLDTTLPALGDSGTRAACAQPRPGPGLGTYVKRIVAGESDVISIARGFAIRTEIPERPDHIKAGDERLDLDFRRRSSSHRALGTSSETTERNPSYWGRSRTPGSSERSSCQTRT
jgi:signal peptidase I